MAHSLRPNNDENGRKAHGRGRKRRISELHDWLLIHWIVQPKTAELLNYSILFSTKNNGRKTEKKLKPFPQKTCQILVEHLAQLACSKHSNMLLIGRNLHPTTKAIALIQCHQQQRLAIWRLTATVVSVAEKEMLFTLKGISRGYKGPKHSFKSLLRDTERENTAQAHCKSTNHHQGALILYGVLGSWPLANRFLGELMSHR